MPLFSYVYSKLALGILPSSIRCKELQEQLVDMKDAVNAKKSVISSEEQLKAMDRLLTTY